MRLSGTPLCRTRWMLREGVQEGQGLGVSRDSSRKWHDWNHTGPMWTRCDWGQRLMQEGGVEGVRRSAPATSPNPLQANGILQLPVPER